MWRALENIVEFATAVARGESDIVTPSQSSDPVGTYFQSAILVIYIVSSHIPRELEIACGINWEGTIQNGAHN